jgi:hypothetical protein
MATQIIEEHRSADGLLRFLVIRDLDGDIALGFDGFPWHTHADILASLSGLSENEPVRQFVDDLLNGRAIIGIARVGDTIRDVWVTDRPSPDKYKPEDETVEFRYWDGTPAL